MMIHPRPTISPPRVFWIVVAATLSSAASASEIPSQSDGMIVLRQCLIEYERNATLGAAEGGIFQKCEVKLGDRVKAGQVLGRVRDDDLRAQLELHKAEAASDVTVRSKQKDLLFKVGRLKAAESLRQRQFVSDEEYRQLKLEVDIAELAIEDAEHQRNLARLKARATEVGVASRQFVSPIDGIVSQLLKEEGESISYNDPVFRIVDPSRLRITGEMDVADVWRVREGDRVRITAEIGGVDIPLEREEFTGRVSFVAQELEPGQQTCSIIALVDNRGEKLRAGLKCRMSIEPGTATETDTARAATGNAGKAQGSEPGGKTTAANSHSVKPSKTANVVKPGVSPAVKPPARAFGQPLTGPPVSALLPPQRRPGL
jgi:RND family efflux transporter MFP subunit